MQTFKICVGDNKFNEDGSKYCVRPIHMIQLLFQNDEVRFPNGETDDKYSQDEELSYYCTCLRKMFQVNYFRGKHNQRSAAPLMLLLFFVFSSEVFNSGIKSCYDEVVYQDPVCEERFSIRLWCLHL